ncbi:hypothetical protein TRFO_05580 [Tritrichomonas foetus]|uniref:Uncharacterized protein n=1 Tax=Tritrichomonas foetus TaxID=1144522 RepID=A0A1J4K4R4_9EUKA|nr:hypothetical protein TRFO_05580 [Tritrichomonas foetus]|eukprot:OHT06383.1 hypothetical protein TRFO_05580 [Tritrichomonas foetus]
MFIDDLLLYLTFLINLVGLVTFIIVTLVNRSTKLTMDNYFKSITIFSIYFLLFITIDTPQRHLLIKFPDETFLLNKINSYVTISQISSIIFNIIFPFISIHLTYQSNILLLMIINTSLYCFRIVDNANSHLIAFLLSGIVHPMCHTIFESNYIKDLPINSIRPFFNYILIKLCIDLFSNYCFDSALNKIYQYRDGHLNYLILMCLSGVCSLIITLLFKFSIKTLKMNQQSSKVYSYLDNKIIFSNIRKKLSSMFTIVVFLIECCYDVYVMIFVNHISEFFNPNPSLISNEILIFTYFIISVNGTFIISVYHHLFSTKGLIISTIAIEIVLLATAAFSLSFSSLLVMIFILGTVDGFLKPKILFLKRKYYQLKEDDSTILFLSSFNKALSTVIVMFINYYFRNLPVSVFRWISILVIIVMNILAISLHLMLVSNNLFYM